MQIFNQFFSVMVQYHALGVLYHIRKSDRLAVTKLVAKLTRMALKSPYAVCMLVCRHFKFFLDYTEGSKACLYSIIILHISDTYCMQTS